MWINRIVTIGVFGLSALAASPSQAASNIDQWKAGMGACRAAFDLCQAACEINNPNSFSGWLACDLGCEEKWQACTATLDDIPVRQYSVQNNALTQNLRQSLQLNAN